MQLEIMYQVKINFVQDFIYCANSQINIFCEDVTWTENYFIR